jgi:acetoin utilization protein AcuB
MSKLTVRGFMTAAPHTIGADQTLATAHALMRKHQIRHLPVLRGSKLVGLLSQRDILFIENLPGVEPDRVLVEEAMSEDPFAISPETSLEWVATEMGEHKYGSAVILDHGKVVGVFTTIDALTALQELLRRERRRRPRTPVRNAS